MLNFIPTENIFKSINIPIFVRDAYGKYVYINDAFLKLLNVSKEEILGKNIKDVFVNDYSDFLLTDEFIENGFKEKIFEFYCKTLNKELMIIKSFFYNNSEKYIIGGIIDITNIKLEERKEVFENHKIFLSQFEKLLLISGMMSNLTHQISQPLNAIKILVDTNLKFENEVVKKEDLLQDYEFISSQLNRIEDIINRLRFLENAEPQNEVGIVNLTHSIFTSLDLINSYLTEENFKLKTNIDSTVYVSFPQFYIEYVISNIILYLLNYSPQNISHKEIGISIEEEDENIILNIIVNYKLEKLINPNNIFNSKIEGKDLYYGIIISAIINLLGRYSSKMDIYNDNNTVIKISFKKLQGYL
ncbi:MAG TPA: PAS domain-containing protein [Ignavibacteriales bacterium]|mgnify:CR=1 FL=1|nr:PAS domain-containing protein [Ignavibacteriales bacterium]HOL80287.1 PAS domain-containing protein [Ignavibacteriales bacterium]HOM64566.1 PAS domain-containing protein [Ignavibacteriales bacterium]HPD66663.1 PAS domain-containing protein [Ignavibacteriales bacterium]HPP32476.1 PAS domain-containing protein [Ignavibacteriales bacterium]